MAQAQTLVAQIKMGFQELGPVAKGASFLYFIWKDPYFVVGPNTYINALLTHFGLQNLLLHSWKLNFTPPYSTDPIQLVCSPPTHFSSTASLLGWNLNELR